MTKLSRAARSVTALLLVGAVAVGTAPVALAQAAGPDSKYQAAQRNISTTIALLEAYLKQNPNGKYAPIANIQLNGLQNLKSSASAPIPVPLSGGIYVQGEGPIIGEFPGTEWSVASVQKQSDKTVVTLTIHNITNDKNSGFWSFDRTPLSLVDNKGQFYDMQSVETDLPAGVTIGKDGNTQQAAWVLQPGQTIQVVVDFDPLGPGATGGKITYKSNEGNQPAAFSLLNRRQTGQ